MQEKKENVKADGHLEYLRVRPPGPEPVCRDDASLERAVSVTPRQPVLTLRVGRG